MDAARLGAAREAGQFVGSLIECGVDMCAWMPGGLRPDLRHAWLIGFGLGRVAFMRLADQNWPHVEIALAAFPGD